MVVLEQIGMVVTVTVAWETPAGISREDGTEATAL
jgi:hypothetical protein